MRPASITLAPALRLLPSLVTQTSSESGGEASDEILMRRAADGDHDAFVVLLARHERWARSYALRVLGSSEDAEEAAQDAFIQLWRSAPRWQPRSHLRAYLAALVSSRCLDILRRRPRGIAEELTGTLALDAPGPAEFARRAEEAAHLRDAILRLPTRQRMAVLLFHGEELSLRDSATAMDLSPKAFESLLIRARRSLRQLLERSGDEVD